MTDRPTATDAPKMPPPPADLKRLTPPPQSPEQRRRLSEQLRKVAGSIDDGLTDAEAEAFLRERP